jgi:hypothetical protein
MNNLYIILDLINIIFNKLKLKNIPVENIKKNMERL